jgi:hypothetical protein
MVVRQTRWLAECMAELEVAPASMLVLEVSAANLANVLELAVDLDRRFPLARLAVVADRGMESYEWVLREAGAVHFTTSPRTAGDLARIAVRHAACVPQPPATLAAQVWESLPWHEAAIT